MATANPDHARQRWRNPSRDAAAAVLAFAAALPLSGCLAIATNTTLLSDTSHLGTPYSGTRADLHTLVCYGRDLRRDASSLLFAPFMLLPLVDTPLSFAVDTVLLPLDLALEPERPPLRISGQSCRLIGM